MNDVIGERYELSRRIGSGGMAQVFLATDRSLRRQVAVKILSEETAADPVFVERFRREAQAVAQLNHPNIVSIYDWGPTLPESNRDASIYYMVMEYVPGDNLKERLRGGALPEAEALDIAAQVASALEVAHRNGVIHRDIKPQNVLLAPFGMVKVVDFGIAHTAGVTQLTKTNAVAGTAHYLSPEQAQSRSVDNRSDLYSLGVVLFEMLTGRELFEGSTLVEIAMHHVHDTPPLPTSLNSKISPAGEAVVMRALEKQPAQRFADASQMRAALLEARSGVLSSDTSSGRPTVTAPLAGSSTAMKSSIERASGGAQRRARPGTGLNQGERRWPARLLMAVPAALLLLVGLPIALIWQSNNGTHGNPPRSAAGAHPASTLQSTQHRTNAAVHAHPTATVHSTAKPAATAGTTRPGAGTNNSVPSPLPTRGPSIAALQQAPVAPVSTTVNGSPTRALSSFYQMISAGNLAGAVSLETTNMKTTWPPQSAIFDRFAQTQQITIQQSQVLSRSGNVARVGVSGFDLEKPGSPRSNQSFYLVWTLVKVNGGWMLDSVST